MGDRYFLTLILLLAVALLVVPVNYGHTSETKGTASIERISPEDARSKVQSGEALLVCSYDDGKCKKVLLEGALLRSEFENRVPVVSKDQEIIFYCA